MRHNGRNASTRPRVVLRVDPDLGEGGRLARRVAVLDAAVSGKVLGVGDVVLSPGDAVGRGDDPPGGDQGAAAEPVAQGSAARHSVVPHPHLPGPLARACGGPAVDLASIALPE